MKQTWWWSMPWRLLRECRDTCGMKRDLQKRKYKYLSKLVTKNQQLKSRLCIPRALGTQFVDQAGPVLRNQTQKSGIKGEPLLPGSS